MFKLLDDHVTIREAALEFATERLAPKAIEWDEAKSFPVDVIREAAALGMGAIYVREDIGGSGLTRLHAALIFEALATGCPSVSAYISIHNMCAWIIDRYGSDAQRQKWLPDLVHMKKLASYCLTEPGAGSDAAALKTRARREGGVYVLNGQKQFISGAGNPNSFYIVMARTGDEGPSGISTFIVDGRTPGLSVGANERKMGWNAQPTRSVTFEDCRIPADQLIGPEGIGFKIAMSGLDGGRLNIAACSLGGATSAVNKAISYMGERKTFGKPLTEFQALQFRVADMATELEAARIFLYSAAVSLDDQAPNRTTRIAMAKRFVTDAGFKIANDALQLLGGYGYLVDYGIEKIVRDLRVHQILEGTNEIMRLIIARELLGHSRPHSQTGGQR
jgi:alkylation response protein AidB-like acyl-CoA dehydrogenase